MKFTTVEPSKDTNFNTLKTLLPYLWPKKNCRLRLFVIISCLSLVLSKLANISVPIIFRELIDGMTMIDTMASLGEQKNLIFLPLSLIFSYGLARISSQLFSDLKDALFVRVSQQAVRTLARSVFEHLHGLSLRFHLDRKTGGVSRAIERGTKGIETLLRFLMFNIIPTFLEISFVAIVLWNLFGFMFALATLGTLGLYILFTLKYTQWRMTILRAMNKVDSEANTKAIDSLLNFETVKYFGNETHEVTRYDDSLQQYEKKHIKSTQSLAGLNTGQSVIVSLGLVLIMWMASRKFLEGTMTLGDFVLVNTYLIQLYIPLNILGFAYREIKFSLINLEEMFDLLREKEEIKDIENAPALSISKAAITFDKVCFHYNSDREILKDISFQVPAGKTVAIVGSSGAGKSTLSRLLFRFYEAQSGQISIDDQDIYQVTQKSLRHAIGIVPQDTVLFNDTIYYNIAYGRPHATPEEVVEVSKMAKIHDFIESLPQKYDTLVGERGLKLSGGEKQRVAIARTLLKRPSIFLFDEATSALDTQTEKKIQQSLREVSSNHTTLVIAHRLSTVISADEILVLDHGEIKERGTHQELLATKGLYSTMWEKQQDAEKGPNWQ